MRLFLIYSSDVVFEGIVGGCAIFASHIWKASSSFTRAVSSVCPLYAIVILLSVALDFASYFFQSTKSLLSFSILGVILYGDCLLV